MSIDYDKLTDFSIKILKQERKTIFTVVASIMIVVIVVVGLITYFKDSKGSTIATQIKIDQEEKINRLNHELNSLKSQIHPWLNHTPV